MDNKARSAPPTRMLAKVAALVLLALLVACIAWAMDRMSLGVELATYAFGYGFFVNAIPFVLLLLLFLAMTNRTTLALLVTLALAAALAFANYQKLQFLSRPLSYGDLLLLRDLNASTAHLLLNYVNRWYLLLAMLMLAAWIAASALLERGFFARRSIPRLFLGVATLVGLAVLATGPAWLAHVYGAKKIRTVPWAPALTILHSGLASWIVHANMDSAQALNVPIDREAVAKFEAMPAPGAAIASIPAPVHPDIIVIQSESFFDPSILKDIEDTSALLPNLHRALATGVGGTMKAPTFGGGTLRTEFEVLTGIPMAAYPRIDFPYLKIHKKHIPSLVEPLHAAGYKVYAVHGNDGSFWNRTKTFKAFGFDRFITAEDFPPTARRDGRYLSDAAMTDQIMELLDDARSPTMIFAISIEAHGPYSKAPVADMAKRNAIPAPATWPDAAIDEYRNYVYHIRDADQQLGRLWNWLEERHRPFVLVFYGDHLPGFQYVYAQSSFDDHKKGSAEYVPWFILSGGGNHLAPRKQHIRAWMLGSEVLRAAGLRQPPYYQMVYKAERILSGPAATAHEGDVSSGINSLSRLRLSGGLKTDTGTAAKTGTGS